MDRCGVIGSRLGNDPTLTADPNWQQEWNTPKGEAPHFNLASDDRNREVTLPLEASFEMR